MRRFSAQDPDLDWYWIVDDETVYHNRRNALLPATDADFLAWGGRDQATRLMRHDGETVEVALNALLGGYGLPLFAPPAPGVAELQGYASVVQNRMLASVWSFDLAASGQPAHVVTTRLDAAGNLAMLKIVAWAQINAGKAQAALPYSNVDYSGTSLNPAEADLLATKAGDVEVQSYAILNRVAAEITASPATITTFAQIDTAFASLTPAA